MSHTSTMPTGASGGGGHVFAREGYARAQAHDLTTAEVESAKVYGREDETIGSISSLTVGADGKISHAVIDVGGFLGIGAHSVLVPFGNLTVLRTINGSEVRVHMDTTKETLKAMPHHDH